MSLWRLAILFLGLDLINKRPYYTMNTNMQILITYCNYLLSLFKDKKVFFILYYLFPNKIK